MEMHQIAFVASIAGFHDTGNSEIIRYARSCGLQPEVKRIRTA